MRCSTFEFWRGDAADMPEELRAHIDSCEDCRQQFEADRLLWRAVPGGAIETADDREFLLTAQAEGSWKRWRRWTLRGATAAAALLFAGYVGWHLRPLPPAPPAVTPPAYSFGPPVTYVVSNPLPTPPRVRLGARIPVRRSPEEEESVTSRIAVRVTRSGTGVGFTLEPVREE